MSNDFKKLKKDELIQLLIKMDKHAVITKINEFLDSLKDTPDYNKLSKQIDKAVTTIITSYKEDNEFTMNIKGYKNIIPKKLNKHVRMILDPDTIWGKAFYKAIQKEFKDKWKCQMLPADKMKKDEIEALVYIAKEFKEDIFSMINEKEFNKITIKNRKVDNYFNYSDIFYTHNEFMNVLSDKCD